ncbi:MAG TPA: DUF4159 domain-containing protein [Tepidisphaeraceae bacterium]|jgi:hypothetical protein|nr:DUF4159 domain-containing protein [Tepidisphaeraceae bacterium]
MERLPNVLPAPVVSQVPVVLALPPVPQSPPLQRPLLRIDGWSVGLVGGIVGIILMAAYMVHAARHMPTHAGDQANALQFKSQTQSVQEKKRPLLGVPAKAPAQVSSPQRPLTPVIAPDAVRQSSNGASDPAHPSPQADHGGEGGPLNHAVAVALPALTKPATQEAPARPALRPFVEPADKLTDEQIGQSIQRGVDFMLKQFDEKACELRDGLAMNRRAGMPRVANAFHNGADVLCVYALMQCGQAISDPRLNVKGPFMIGCIDATKAFNLDDHFGTYSHGLRATELALNDRKEDEKALRTDVAALIKAQRQGAYTYYNETKDPDALPDNSNSQYGLLGVWSGAEAGVEVPLSYWTAVEKHWTKCQLSNGQWSYRQGASDGRLTMTCAGLASLFVCHDYVDAPRFGNTVGRDPFSPALKKGLDWLETGEHAVSVARGGNWWGYALYGVERVGLASGFKFFGKHNWYPELAREVIARQGPDGGWGQVEGEEDVVNTAYALLFLSRGRHPILMNKLRFDGSWANRPRDAANLAKYASAQIERPLNWQVVPLSHDWTDWTDSAILSLASHVPPKLSDDDVDKIRQYILAGGMLYVQADGDSPAMTPFATELSHRLFPNYELKNVPLTHPLFSSVSKLSAPPPLKMLTNESRILVLYSPTDLARSWQLRSQKTEAGKAIFQLGVNMFIYSAGRRDMRNRLESNVVAPIAAAPVMTVKIARVQYAGAWDPEPYAWTRYARWFQKKTGYALDVHAVNMSELDARQYPFAALTGAVKYNATSDEAAAVKQYVEAGGVLLVDTTGGAGAFDDSIRASLFARAFPAANPKIVPPTHPMLQAGAPGMLDVVRAQLRPYAHEKLGAGAGRLDIFKAGAGHVIFTNLDLTSGLLNTGAWGILGYEPAYSQNFVKNAIFWTLDGQKE